MISEGKGLRIASKAADAVLAAAAAATMAQGPRDFVSFGAIQSPGVVRGQEEGRKRGEADRNLDSGRVSHSARNKKMKTFREFLEEATNKHGIDSDSYSKWISAAEKAHNETGKIKGIAQQTHNGVDYVLRQKGHYKNGKPRFAVTPKKAKQNTEERRQAKKTNLTHRELLNTAKRDLGKSNPPQERAAAALDVEQSRMEKIKNRVKKISKATGIKKSADHLQPLQRKMKNPEYQERLNKVLPGNASSNLSIKSLSHNASKQNTPPKRGEPGRTLTRSGATRDALRRGDTLLNRIDKEVAEIRNGKHK